MHAVTNKDKNHTTYGIVRPRKISSKSHNATKHLRVWPTSSVFVVCLFCFQIYLKYV